MGGRYDDPREFLPAAPLEALLRNRIAEYGFNEVCRQWSDRTGGHFRTAQRHLARLLNGNDQLTPKVQWVSVDNADRWACSMGVHPILLWPEEYPLEDDVDS